MLDRDRLTVTLLPAGTGTMTTELLGLHPSRVSDQEGPVVGNELLLELQGAGRIDVLGVVSDDGLGDGLTDRVELRNVSSTLDAHSDVQHAEGILASYENGLVDFVLEDLWSDELDGGAVDADEATALTSVSDGGSSLLFAESLNGLGA